MRCIGAATTAAAISDPMAGFSATSHPQLCTVLPRPEPWHDTAEFLPAKGLGPRLLRSQAFDDNPPEGSPKTFAVQFILK